MSANLPTPDDFLAEQRRKNLERNPSFQEHLSKLPFKRQQLILTWLANPGLSLNEVAIKAGYKVGPNSKVQNIFKQIQGKLGTAMFEMGITQADVLRALVDAIHATTPIVTKDADGVTSITEVPNHNIRLKAATIMLHLGDYFPAKKFSGKIDHQVSLPQLGERSLQELREIDRRASKGEEIAPEFEVLSGTG